MDFPTPYVASPLGVIATNTIPDLVAASNGYGLYHLAAAAWPAANRALFIPFTVDSPVTVYQMGIWNGAGINGNVDVGIYDQVGTRLVSAGSTAQAGASGIQTFNVTDLLLNPGLYFLAAAASTVTTATYQRAAWGDALSRSHGLCQMATAFALPATATYATYTSGLVPLILAFLNPTV